MKLLFASLLVVSLAIVQKDPTAADAWAQISGATAAVYATVNNPSMYDVYIVSGKSEAAGKVEMWNGDKPVTSVAVPAYGSAELKPGAMFIQLSELKGELKAGDEVKLTLETDGGVSIEIAAILK